MPSKSYSIGLALILGFCGTAHGQVYTGAIWGKVTDSTGGVLPGVAVHLGSENLIRPETTVTSQNGTFRFAELPIGTYRLSFTLAGFQTLIRENVLLDAGATVPVLVQLELGQVSETVIVSGDSPSLDVRQTGTSHTFDRERLENIPSARDPWAVLDQTPGVLLSRKNVGGNESGMPSGDLSRGSRFDQNTWNYDGVDVTMSPTFYDFGAFEEINVTTSGQNPRLQTPGNTVNIVLKQSTQALRGEGAVYGTHHALQGSNIDDELRAQGAGVGTPTKYLLLFTVEAGGPLLDDRMWVWGSFGYQDIHRGVVGFVKPGCDDPDHVRCMEDNPFQLSHVNWKMFFQTTPNNKLNFLFSRNEKTSPNAGASVFRPTLETTRDIGGGSYLYKLEDTHVVNSNLLITGRLAYLDFSSHQDFQKPELRDVQGFLEKTTNVRGRSLCSPYPAVTSERPSIVANFDVNHFVSDRAGGDHELRFGLQYRKNKVDELKAFGGDVQAVFRFGKPVEAQFARPGALSYEMGSFGLYFQDHFTFGRWTVKLGARFDYQAAKNKPSQIPANMVIPEIMPAVDFPGTDTLNAWKNLSPRLGMTYDLTGNSKTLLRAGYSRYSSRMTDADVLFTNAANVSWLALPWTDENGDRFVQSNEVDKSHALGFQNFNPSMPDSLVSPNVIDPALSAPLTDEILVGIEHELIPAFAVGVSYVYRRASNWIWREPAWVGGVQVPYVGVSAHDFVPVEVDFEGETLTYFELPFPRPPGEVLTNRPDYRQRYQALEVTGRKRLSHRWMLGFGFTLADQREFFDSDAAVFDPTNVELRRGAQVFSGTGRYRMMNARWNLKLDGMIQLPAGINVSGKLNGHQGFGYPRSYETRPRGGGIGRAWVQLQPVGEARYEDLWMVDLRFEKTFGLKGTRLSGIFDIFNLLNASTVLARIPKQNSPSANQIVDILAPRVLRFGVRWEF